MPPDKHALRIRWLPGTTQNTASHLDHSKLVDREISQLGHKLDDVARLPQQFDIDAIHQRMVDLREGRGTYIVRPANLAPLKVGDITMTTRTAFVTCAALAASMLIVQLTGLGAPGIIVVLVATIIAGVISEASAIPRLRALDKISGDSIGVNLLRVQDEPAHQSLLEGIAPDTPPEIDAAPATFAPSPDGAILEHLVAPPNTRHRREVALKRIDDVFQDYVTKTSDIDWVLDHPTIEDMGVKESAAYWRQAIRVQELDATRLELSELEDLSLDLAAAWKVVLDKTTQLGTSTLEPEQADAARRAKGVHAQLLDPATPVEQLQSLRAHFDKLLVACRISMPEPTRRVIETTTHRALEG